MQPQTLIPNPPSQDELEYKKMQLENTQVTQERLKEELQMRRTELEKIDTLDEKIQSELKQLAERSEQLRTNIETYSKVGRGGKAGECSCCCLWGRGSCCLSTYRHIVNCSSAEAPAG